MTGTKNLGFVQAIKAGTVPPTNIFMLWYDTNTGVNLHKYYNIITSTWDLLVVNTASLPLVKTGINLTLNYNTDQFELLGGTHLSIKPDVLASVTPPFAISDITDLNTTLDSKVDKEAGKSLLSDSEITRLSSVTNYTHPTHHDPSIISQDSDNRFVSDAEKIAWNGKQENLGYTPYNSTNPAGYIDEAFLDSKNFSFAYKLHLPSAGSVLERINLAVEGVDYPTGWILYPAGDNDHDLMIEHSLDKSILAVNIWQISVLGARRLEGNAAFSGLLAPSTNILRIEGLATVSFDIVVSVIFS